MIRAIGHKTDAGNGTFGICLVFNAYRSLSPNPGRSAKRQIPR